MHLIDQGETLIKSVVLTWSLEESC